MTLHLQFTPYIIPLLVAALISIWMMVIVLRQRSQADQGLAGLALVIVIWVLGHTGEIAGTDLATKTFFDQVEYIGIALVPYTWIIFTYNHTHKDNPMPLRIAMALLVVPLITIGIAWTNSWNHLLLKSTYIRQIGAFSELGFNFGPWFWVHATYSYALNLAGAIYIFRSLGNKQGVYGGQRVSIVIAILVPWVANLLYITGLTPFLPVDLTPYGFTVTVTAFTLSIYGFGLISLTPLARDFVIEAMPDGMIVVDLKNRISDMNPAALQLFGLNYRESIGKEFREVFKSWPHLQERIGNEAETLGEFTIGKDEQERLFEINNTPLANRSQGTLGRVITIREMTERKRADEQLRQLSRAVEASPVSIMITDTQAKIQYVNPKFCEETGYTREEVLGRNPRILKSDLTPPETHRQLWETITAGQEWRGELCNHKKNGELFWESASISPVPDAANQIAYYVAVKENITERKKIGEVFASARDQALETSRKKSQMLGAVGASLQLPMRRIQRSIKQLQEPGKGELAAEQKRVLTQITERSQYVTRLADELSDMTKLEEGSLRLQQNQFSPSTLVKTIAAPMSQLAHNKGLSFMTTVSAGTPEQVLGDEIRLGQVLTNLVAQAIQSSTGGNVSIRTLSFGNDAWSIQVTDSNKGIHEDDLRSMFEPFNKQPGVSSEEELITGLGLSISKSLVELMGGRITVESREGQGCIYSVTLPIKMKRKDTASPDTQPLPKVMPEKR
ncbi:MAG: histidine kinase N-terminal 7TM domain-containing protein [Anaerolineales bacterium]